MGLQPTDGALQHKIGGDQGGRNRKAEHPEHERGNRNASGGKEAVFHRLRGGRRRNGGSGKGIW